MQRIEIVDIRDLIEKDFIGNNKTIYYIALDDKLFKMPISFPNVTENDPKKNYIFTVLPLIARISYKIRIYEPLSSINSAKNKKTKIAKKLIYIDPINNGANDNINLFEKQSFISAIPFTTNAEFVNNSRMPIKLLLKPRNLLKFQREVSIMLKCNTKEVHQIVEVKRSGSSFNVNQHLFSTNDFLVSERGNVVLKSPKIVPDPEIKY